MDKKLIYNYKELYDPLDDITFSSELLIRKLNKREYLNNDERELLIEAIEVCVNLLKC